MYEYDQIFLAGGGLQKERVEFYAKNGQESGRALQLVEVKGNPTILELLDAGV